MTLVVSTPNSGRNHPTHPQRTTEGDDPEARLRLKLTQIEGRLAAQRHPSHADIMSFLNDSAEAVERGWVHTYSLKLDLLNFWLDCREVNESADLKKLGGLVGKLYNSLQGSLEVKKRNTLWSRVISRFPDVVGAN